MWLAPLAFLFTFFFVPFARILAFGAAQETIAQPNLQLAWRTLAFTSYQAGLSLLLTLAVGLPLSVFIAMYEFRGRRLLRALISVPFMLPTVVVAAGFSALLGPRGWVNLMLIKLLGLELPPVQIIGTLGSILLAHVFYNTTIVVRLVGGALENMDPRLPQAARALGADSTQVWRTVTLPLLRPAILSACLLVLLFDFTSFGVILLLGGPAFRTLEVEIYIQALQQLNLPVAALLALVQLLFTLAVSIGYTRLVYRSRVATAPRTDSMRRPIRSTGQKLIASLLVLLILALFLMPMLALPVRSFAVAESFAGGGFTLSTSHYTALFSNSQGSAFYVPPIEAARNSLLYGLTTVLVTLALAFPAASALAAPGRLERVLDPVLVLPLGASAVTLGLGFIVTFGGLLASPFMVPLAHSLVALPFVIRALQPALASIPQRLRQSAAVLGASPWRTWWAVDWPILRRATISAAGFAFTISLGEFGATSLLTRPQYPTVPIAIFQFLSRPGSANYGQAMAMATLLLVLTTISILMIEKLRLPGTTEL